MKDYIDWLTKIVEILKKEGGISDSDAKETLAILTRVEGITGIDCHLDDYVENYDKRRYSNNEKRRKEGVQNLIKQLSELVGVLEDRYSALGNGESEQRIQKNLSEEKEEGELEIDNSRNDETEFDEKAEESLTSKNYEGGEIEIEKEEETEAFILPELTPNNLKNLNKAENLDNKQEVINTPKKAARISIIAMLKSRKAKQIANAGLFAILLLCFTFFLHRQFPGIAPYSLSYISVLLAIPIYFIKFRSLLRWTVVIIVQIILICLCLFLIFYFRLDTPKLIVKGNTYYVNRGVKHNAHVDQLYIILGDKIDKDLGKEQIGLARIERLQDTESEVEIVDIHPDYQDFSNTLDLKLYDANLPVNTYSYGRITEYDGKIAIIDLGAKSGIKEGDILNVLGKPVVSLDLTSSYLGRRVIGKMKTIMVETKFLEAIPTGNSSTPFEVGYFVKYEKNQALPIQPQITFTTPTVVPGATPDDSHQQVVAPRAPSVQPQITPTTPTVVPDTTLDDSYQQVVAPRAPSVQSQITPTIPTVVPDTTPGDSQSMDAPDDPSIVKNNTSEFDESQLLSYGRYRTNDKAVLRFASGVDDLRYGYAGDFLEVGFADTSDYEHYGHIVNLGKDVFFESIRVNDDRSQQGRLFEGIDRDPANFIKHTFCLLGFPEDIKNAPRLLNQKSIPNKGDVLLARSLHFHSSREYFDRLAKIEILDHIDGDRIALKWQLLYEREKSGFNPSAPVTQTTLIIGRIVETSTRKSVPQASIIIYDKNFNILADVYSQNDGNFSASIPYLEQVNIDIYKDGFSSARISVDVDKKTENYIGNIAISKTSEIEELEIKGNVIMFILDTSSSMEGRFENLKQQLKESLKTLSSDKRFNIICFNDRAQSWSDHPEIANPENINSAFHYLDRVRVGGGTVLSMGLRKCDEMSFFDTVYILSDGEFGESDIDTAKHYIKLLSDRFQQEVAVNTVHYGESKTKANLSSLDIFSLGVHK